MTKLAIMQPYIFPYIGYFNLIHSVDKFMFYNDVNFIKRGWINRNKILSNKREFLFSIPLIKASQSRKINDIKISYDSKWKEKLLRNIRTSYGRYNQFGLIYPIIEDVFLSDHDKISELAMLSVIRISEYLDIGRIFSQSSDCPTPTTALRGQDRIIKICEIEGATEYHNPMGGISLYSHDLFTRNNIGLNFIEPKLTEYTQSSDQFISGLSIIDILMSNEKEDVQSMVRNYSTIKKSSFL